MFWAHGKTTNTPAFKGASEPEKKEKQDSRKELEYTDDHVNPASFYNEALIIKVWEAHIQTKKLKYYYCMEGEAETIVETLFVSKDSVSLSKNAGLLVNSDGSLYKRKDVKTSVTSSISICNSVNHRLDSRKMYNAISFNLKIALEQVVRWNKDKKKEPLRSHLIIFPYHPTENHWNLGVLELKLDAAGRADFVIKAFDPYGGGTINQMVREVLEKLCIELFKNVKDFKYYPQTDKEHPKQQNDGAACGPITGQDGKDVIDGTVHRLAKSYSFGAIALRLRHLTQVQCERFYKSQWLDERQYTDSATKGNKEIDDKKSVIDKLISFINGLSEKIRREFFEAFDVLSQVCKEEKGKFIKELIVLRDKEISNTLTEKEKLKIARLCLDEVYVKHKLEELILDPYKWPIRKLRALILLHKKAFEKANLFNIFMTEGSVFASGAISLLEEVAAKNRIQIKIAKKRTKAQKDEKPPFRGSENIILFSSYSGFISSLSSVEVYDKDGILSFQSAEEDDVERVKERITMEWMDDRNGLGKYLKKNQDLTNQLLDIKLIKEANKERLLFRYSLPTRLVQILLEAINRHYSELERQRKEESLDLFISEIEKNITTIKQDALQALVKAMEKEQSKANLNEAVNIKQALVNIYNSHKKLSHDNDWLFCFFKGKPRKIDSSTEMNSQVFLPEAWKRLFSLLKNKLPEEMGADADFIPTALTSSSGYVVPDIQWVTAMPSFEPQEMTKEGDKSSTSLAQGLEVFIKSPKSRLLLISGPSGIGKTRALSYIEEQAKKQDIEVISIPLNLYSEYDVSDSQNAAIRRKLKGLKLSAKSEKIRLLILDAQDELKRRAGLVNIYQNNELSHWQNLKVIITCRQEILKFPYAHFFKSDETEGSFVEWRILPLDAKAQQTYIQQLIKEFQAIDKTYKLDLKECDEALKHLPQELAGNPLILKFCLRGIPSLKRQISKGLSEKPSDIPFNRYQIYKAAINAHFVREQEKGALEGIRLDEEQSQYRLIYTQEMALQLWKRNTKCLLLSDWKLSLFPETRKTLSLKSPEEQRSLLLKEHSRFFLEYTGIGKEQSYQFQHPSIQEYLVVNWLMLNSSDERVSFKALQDLLVQYDISPTTLIMDEGVLKFLQDTLMDILHNDKLAKRLDDMISSTRQDKSLGRLASIAITLLNIARVNFSHKDYRNVSIPGAILQNSLCYQTNFQGSDLSHVKFQMADLTLANLSACQMQGTKFGQYPSYQVGGDFRFVFSDNLEEVLVGYENGEIKIFNFKDNKFIFNCRPSSSDIGTVYWEPNKKMILSLYRNGQVYLTKQTTKESILINKKVGAEQITTDKLMDVIVIAYRNRCIQFLKHEEECLTPIGQTKSRKEMITSMALNMDKLVVGYIDGIIEIYRNLENKWSLSVQFKAHENQPKIALDEDSSETLVTCGNDGAVRLWNANTGKLIKEYREHSKERKFSACYSSKKALIAVGDFYGYIYLWRTNFSEPIRVEHNNISHVFSVKFNTQKNLIVSADRQGTIAFHDFAQERSFYDLTSLEYCKSVFPIGISSNGKYLASAIGNSDVYVQLNYYWKTLKHYDLSSFNTALYIYHFAISNDATICVGGGCTRDNKTPIMILVKNNKPRLFSFPGKRDVSTQYSSNSIASIVITEDNKYAIFGDKWGTIYVFDIDKEKIAWAYNEPGGRKASIQCCLESNLVVLFASMKQSKVRMLDLNTRKPKEKYNYKFELKSVSISKNGEWIAAGGEDGHIYLSEVGTKKLPLVLRNNIGRIRCLALNHDASLVIAGYGKGVIIVWRRADQAQIAKIINPEETEQIFLSEFEKHLDLFSKSRSGSIRHWIQKKEKGYENQWFLKSENGHARLLASSTNINGVKGISHQNVLLLRQLGAGIGYPFLYPESHPLVKRAKEKNIEEVFCIMDWESQETQQASYELCMSKKFPAVKIRLLKDHPACRESITVVLAGALIESFKKVKGLDYIDLSHNQLDDCAMLMLANAINGKEGYEGIPLGQCKALVLSHNKISRDGLKVLLKALAARPSITQLLLDNNWIDFNLEFLEDEVKPLSQQAGIVNLELTLNFIPKGHQFEEVINGSLIRIYYERSLIEQRLLNIDKPKSNRNAIKTFFCASSYLHSTRYEPRHKQSKSDEYLPMHPITSLIASIDSNNRDKIIDIDWGTIGLFAIKSSLKDTSKTSSKREHAYLVLEGIATFGQRYLIRGDLYGTKNGGVLIAISHCSPQDFIKFTSDGERIHCQSGKFTREEIKAVLKEMDEFRRKQEGFSDYRALPNDTESTYNCLKWAVEMLKAAGIKKDLTHWLPSSELSRESRCIIC